MLEESYISPSKFNRQERANKHDDAENVYVGNGAGALTDDARSHGRQTEVTMCGDTLNVTFVFGVRELRLTQSSTFFHVEGN
jgi:hypothetical protein